MKRTVLLGIAAAAIALTGCGNSGGSVVATVNGDPISFDEYTKFMEVKPKIRVRIGGQSQMQQLPDGSAIAVGDVMDSVGLQTLYDLIQEKLVLQLAKEKGVLPNEADVDAELEFNKKRNPDFLKQATSNGYTVARIKSELTLQLANERIVTKGVTVTDDDVNKWIASNKDNILLREPETADLQYLRVSAANKAKVDQALLGQQLFTSVANQYNEDPGARETGHRFPKDGTRYLAAMPKALQDIVRATGEGKVSTWKEQPDGWYKIYVSKITPAKDRVVDATLRTVIRRRIAMERGSQALDLNKQLSDKFKSSKIEVPYENLKDRWKKTMDAILAEDKKTATAPKQ